MAFHVTFTLKTELKSSKTAARDIIQVCFYEDYLQSLTIPLPVIHGLHIRDILGEQLGTAFTQDFSFLSHNLTAVAQTDASSGYGPAYLLNGLTYIGLV